MSWLLDDGSTTLRWSPWPSGQPRRIRTDVSDLGERRLMPNWTSGQRSVVPPGGVAPPPSRVEAGRAFCYATGANIGSRGRNQTCDYRFNKPVPRISRGIPGMEPMAGTAPASPHYECGVLLLNHTGVEAAAGLAPASALLQSAAQLLRPRGRIFQEGGSLARSPFPREREEKDSFNPSRTLRRPWAPRFPFRRD